MLMLHSFIVTASGMKTGGVERGCNFFEKGMIHLLLGRVEYFHFHFFGKGNQLKIYNQILFQTRIMVW